MAPQEASPSRQRLQRLLAHVLAPPVMGGLFSSEEEAIGPESPQPESPHPWGPLRPASTQAAAEALRKLFENHRKYAAERDKRLHSRPEGNAQYKRILDLAKTDERFARMLTDPYCHVPCRRPMSDKVEVIIIGAGYGGLVAGARLRQAGLEASQIRLLDVTGDVGGTWYWNRYPGAACDVESYCYMPLLEEMGYVPTERYPSQPELFRHSQMIAERYGLYEKALFGTKVTQLLWHEDLSCWIVSTDRGDELRAQFVIMNFGTFTQPKLPGVPGLESFKGHMFHTARWDYEYTGGSPLGHLTKLADKRVAIVGTGATAVQAIPHLGAHAKELYVFQRTPSSVGQRRNWRTTPKFVEEHLSKPGWQKERQENFTLVTQDPTAASKDVVQDGFTEILTFVQRRAIDFAKEMKSTNPQERVQAINHVMGLADLELMETIRSRVSEVVRDPQTAEALKPYYYMFCKRPCFHEAYLETFNRPNVTLVNTDGKGIDRITPSGIVFAGKEYEVDCIVMATGFETGYNSAGLGPQKVGYDIIGRGGQRLSEKWANGPKTFFSYHSSGFPNLFMLNAPQGVFCVNFVHPLDEGAKHATYVIMTMRYFQLKNFDPWADSEERYVKYVNSFDISQDVRFRKACTPGYYNNEGHVMETSDYNFRLYPGGALTFFHLLEQWRQDGTFMKNLRVD